MTHRARVHAILEATDEAGITGRLVNIGLLVLIFANVLAVVIETVAGVGERHAAALSSFETISVTVFSVEYLLRLWSCTADPRYAHPVSGRLRCALRPLVLIDLIAILPALLPFGRLDLRTLRSLRLLRILRLLKLTRHSRSLQTFGAILRSKAPELGSTLFVMLLLLVMSSSMMYFLERDDNPAFSSIPAAMWWGIATFTTVGYGDITPITPGGRLLGGVAAILGIAMFAIPAGVLGAAFSAEMEKRRRQGDEP
ncbi:MAG: ion transporter [Planctomycetes bacterium]|nr:ion transporter [Planctomycetota bacterium]